MGLKNGRTDYEGLREKYDRVHIRHTLSEDGTARTLCLLTLDNSVFVGVARFSNRTFSFSKKKGRAIAQGRAEHAFNVFNGDATKRVSQEKRREELSYIIIGTDENPVDSILESFLGKSESK